jgi:uncharacterized protein
MADGNNGIPRRKLEETDVTVSAMAAGGHDTRDAQDQRTALQLIARAIDTGITSFDNCGEYHRSKSEEWMGTALRGKRDRAFPMTKVCTHCNKGLAMQKLAESLRRLQTDHLDPWQVHEVVYWNAPDKIFASGGVKALLEAKRQGKVRLVGFTGHKATRIHLKMLSPDFPFDRAQMPLDCFDGTLRSAGRRAMPELTSRRIAPLGMKGLGGSGEMLRHGSGDLEGAAQLRHEPYGGEPLQRHRHAGGAS